MKAVSSPSLSENLVEKSDSTTTAPRSSTTAQNNPERPTVSPHHYDTAAAAVPHASVLQKLKNTLSHLKSNKPEQNAMSATSSLTDATTSYRFGPLVWRSSKERRRAKHQRRDKCNSGDSGIQIELENEETNKAATTEALPSISAGYTVNVRRANSAKSHTSSSASAAARSKVAARKQQNASGRRSLSQATGLDKLSIGEFRHKKVTKIIIKHFFFFNFYSQQ